MMMITLLTQITQVWLEILSEWDNLFFERSKGNAEKQVITWNYFRFNTRRRGRETFWKS